MEEGPAEDVVVTEMTGGFGFVFVVEGGAIELEIIAVLLVSICVTKCFVVALVTEYGTEGFEYEVYSMDDRTHSRKHTYRLPLFPPAHDRV